MKQVKVLGIGCRSCNHTHALVDGRLVHAGGSPTRAQVESWFQEVPTK
ncbi:MAG TPA: hypothetical protein PLH72_04695 [Vicinamibacterales bacterium]|nr:hypothetical protein [Vicinamibacterales bacterium]